MQRSKQQALMFLLGAVLVGGALGMSADRYIVHDKFASQYGPRTRFYDEMGLSEKQRNALDSLAFQQDCAIRMALLPQKPVLDSIKKTFKAQTHNVFTPDQLKKLDERNKEIKARRDAEQAKEPKRTCPGN
jgi:Spy/CpxP family protein refolding chaperone